jgi:predicted deacetylase
MILSIAYQSVFAVIGGIFQLISREKRIIKNKPLSVVFRYDDFASWSDTATELKIIDIFRQNNISLTLSVVPYNVVVDSRDSSHQDVVTLSNDKGEILKVGYEEGILDIALHGYTHMVKFQGLDYHTQLEKIAKGKEFLENMIGAPVTTFVPTFNSYDYCTLQALEALGFLTISANKHGVATEDSKLNFLPFTHYLRSIKRMHLVSRALLNSRDVIVILIHPSDFKENNKKMGCITIPEFAKLVKGFKLDKNIRVCSINQVINVTDDLSAHRHLLQNSPRSLLGIRYRKKRAKDLEKPEELSNHTI